MSQILPRYKFYATLLDAFTWYQCSEADDAFQEMINKINRVPFESEAAERGTAFNELVDQISDEYLKTGLLPDDDVLIHNGFEFDGGLVNQFAVQFRDSIRQLYTERIIDTRFGPVLLYGYIDELEMFTVYDIKTTKNYEFGKYIRNWQHKVYLYCLQPHGIDTFQYAATDFEFIFKEEYVWKDTYQLDLRLFCEELITFIEDHRGIITDRKIFALENEPEQITIA